jgi:hypothetical protein
MLLIAVIFQALAIYLPSDRTHLNALSGVGQPVVDRA